jgi:hypothetical protein
VRFRQVESFVLTNLHEFGLAERPARAAAKRLNIASKPITVTLCQRQGGSLLAAGKARWAVTSRAATPDRATTPTTNDRGIGTRAGGSEGTSIPIRNPEDVGFLWAMGPLSRRPGDNGSGRMLAWSGRGVCQRQRRRGPTDRADHTVFRASASSHVDCF